MKVGSKKDFALNSCAQGGEKLQSVGIQFQRIRVPFHLCTEDFDETRPACLRLGNQTKFRGNTTSEYLSTGAGDNNIVSSSLETNRADLHCSNASGGTGVRRKRWEWDLGALSVRLVSTDPQVAEHKTHTAA